jgi:MFS family permease
MSDVVPTHTRGAVISVFAMGFLFGPVIWPIFSSYPPAALGWWWVFWLQIFWLQLFFASIVVRVVLPSHDF